MPLIHLLKRLGVLLTSWCLLCSGASAADNGRILMKDRVLTEIDEEAVNAHILESSKRLWGRLNHKEY